MSDIANERLRLYEEAKAAFAAAHELASRNPQPMSPEWFQWHGLVDLALAANREYVRFITAGPLPPPPDDDTISDSTRCPESSQATSRATVDDKP